MMEAAALILLLLWLIILSRMTGGELRYLASVSWRGVPLLMASALVSVLGPVLGRPWSSVLFIVGLSGIVAVLFWNRLVARGVSLMILGALLNAGAVLANGAMPVSQSALTAASGSSTADVDAKHSLVEAPSGLTILVGDTLPIPNSRVVVSIGDVLLLVGASIVFLEGTATHRQSV